MTLLSPWALMLAALVLVVLAFHIRRRKTLPVPSLRLWRQLEAGQVRRNRVLQWPQPSWALLLQVLAVLAMVGALAQPLFNRGEAVDHWIFVVDRSAAEQAREMLAGRLEGRSGGGLVSLVRIGSRAAPLVARQPLGDPGIEAALAAIGAEDGPADWVRLKPILAALTQPEERTRVVVYSDARPAIDGEVEHVAVGGPVANAALSGDLSPNEDNDAERSFRGTVRLEGGMREAELVVGYAAEANERPLEWDRITVRAPPNATADETVARNVSLDFALPGPGIVSLSLGDDAKAYDNTLRYITAEGPQTLDVLYVGSGEQPLLLALRAVEGVSIYQADGLPDDLGQFGLVVVDGVQVARQPETNVVWIGDAGIEAEPLAPLPAQSPTDSRRDHPLMRGVAWDALSVNAAFAVAPGAGDEVLLRDDDAALVTVGSNEYGRTVRLAFDPRQSNWPGQPGFPVFASNLVAWLGLTPQGPVRDPCMVGAQCMIDARFIGGTIERLGDAGLSAPVQAGAVVLERAGLYRLQKGERTALLAVNPVIADVPVTEAGEPAEQAAFPLSLWPVLLVVALLLLLVEAVLSGRGTERFLQAEGLRSTNPLSRRRRLTAILRAAGVALVVLALLDVGLPWRQAGEHVATVLAPAGSVPVNAGITVVDGPEQSVASGEAEVPQREGATEDAVLLAAATIPWGQPGRVAVTGQTHVDPDSVARLALPMAQRQVVVDALPLAPAAADIAVTSIEAPWPVYEGDTFPLTGIIRSAGAGEATIRFTRNAETLVEQQAMLVAGDNRIEAMVADVAAGTDEYALSVIDAADVVADNDRLATVIETRPVGTVAVISPDPARSQAFMDWLDSQGMAGQMIEPRRAPYRLDDWRAFDGAVLLDVPAIALTTPQQEAMERAVADLGMGLLILGGPNSFGPGGYLETPLDRISPISSRVPRDAPEATLVFVLDRSGSMQQQVGDMTRLDVAKEATLAATNLLDRQSQVGIIVFDAEATTVLPLQRIDQPEAVSAALSNVDPGGGTAIYPGLVSAFEMLREVTSPARHIIVMTDGLSQPADFPGLLADIRSAGITVSSVSIGEGAERTVVGQIARLGGGSFHATDDFAALPSILSQEAMLLSGSPVEEGTTQPLWASRSEPFLRGLPAQMPPIDGFVLATAKPEATLSMVVPDNEGEPMPLLASWRFGNGQVLALTTDAAGPWTSRWQGIQAYPALWAQALRQFLPGIARGDVVLDVVRRGDGLVADVTLQGEAVDEPILSVARTDGEAVALPLTRLGSGRFEAAFHPAEAGQFRFTATSGEISAERTAVMNYPAALGLRLEDAGLRRLVEATGGSFRDADSAARRVPERWSVQSFWWGWLALALLVLMAELTVRYTGLIRPRAMPVQPVPPIRRSTPTSTRQRAAAPALS